MALVGSFPCFIIQINITGGCWELSLNLSLLAQLFEHRTVIYFEYP